MNETNPPLTEARLASIELRLERGSERMKALERALAANTDVTTEIRDLIAAAKLGFKVLGWIGAGAKWLGCIASAAAALWAVIYAVTHGGQLPK